MSDLDPKLLTEMTALNDRLSDMLKAGSRKDIDQSEQRLSRLEARLDKVCDDHAETKRMTSILEERINHLPTKPDLWKGLAALLAAITAVITFAEKLQGLVK